ncbi:hypothetical protein JGUZn3_14660 [Entomobacter blattae]|uniref:Uncharacterized protein n=1 Tax=Entomobacter blattae TaxID=2762277 RepID=A0A7H1NSC9_9PROT|nr:hypothetical protein JGUZn3_14660 [Entomobacter blattae]
MSLLSADRISFCFFGTVLLCQYSCLRVFKLDGKILEGHLQIIAHPRVLLILKLHEQFASFLQYRSLKPLNMLYQSSKE